MADFEFEITESDSMVDLEEYFNYLIIERCNEIYYKIISHNPEYQNLQMEIKSFLEELLRVLPEAAQQEIANEKFRLLSGHWKCCFPGLYINKY